VYNIVVIAHNPVVIRSTVWLCQKKGDVGFIGDMQFLGIPLLISRLTDCFLTVTKSEQ
jgi:hypothetical protein